MFYAIAKNKIDLRGYRFEHRLEDIQTLNERALRGELHISAISIHAYAYVADKYALLPCGASMGDGYGPLVIRKRPTSKAQSPISNSEDVRAELRDCMIAVPGKMTSAFLALQLYLGEFKHVVVPFDQIFEAVNRGDADAGLIIHEGQLTYAKSGFEKIVDLGEQIRQVGLATIFRAHFSHEKTSSPKRCRNWSIQFDSMESFNRSLSGASMAATS